MVNKSGKLKKWLGIAILLVVVVWIIAYRETIWDVLKVLYLLLVSD